MALALLLNGILMTAYKDFCAKQYRHTPAFASDADRNGDVAGGDVADDVLAIVPYQGVTVPVASNKHLRTRLGQLGIRSRGTPLPPS